MAAEVRASTTNPRWGVIVLAAGYGSRLHKDILDDDSGQYIHLLGQPKALLPVGGKPLLNHWIHRFEETKGLVDLSRVYIVTNSVMYPKFVKWSNTMPQFDAGNVINDETKKYEERLGAVRDLQLALDLKRKQLKGMDVLVVAGDTLFLSDFNLNSFLERLPRNACGCVHYRLNEAAEVSKRGIVEVDEATGVVKRLLEKPSPDMTTSRFACPAFYALRANVLPEIKAFLELGDLTKQKALDNRSKKDDVDVHFSKHYTDTPGLLMGWLISNGKMEMRTAPLSGRFDIEDLGQWKETLSHFSMVLDEHLNTLPARLVSRVCARVGVLGNPSDGFGGKTMSLSIKNFRAEVTIRASRRLVLVPHPEFDPNSFASLEHLASHTEQNGYYGGLRLLRATCRKFLQLCRESKVNVSGNFTMSYSTTIPRMVGLAGSSAIITAAFKGLLRFYGLKLKDLNLTKELLPQKILDIETSELGINAGLQDRVIQVYGGLVHMNFDRSIVSSCGHGTYKEINPSLLPTLYLAWNTSLGEESGKVHSTVKERWKKGDKTLVDGMKQVGAFADEAMTALEQNMPEKLADLMDRNFAMRRKMYGDNVVGKRNIELVELAKANGMAAKFSGSGGAVVCLRKVDKSTIRPEEKRDPFAFSEEEENKIRLLFISKGYEFARIHVNEDASGVEVGVRRSTSYFKVQDSDRKSEKDLTQTKSGIVLQID